MSRVYQHGMGYRPRKRENPAGRMPGPARGVILAVYDKATTDRYGKPYRTTTVDILLDMGLPPLWNVPVSQTKLNKSHGEFWMPEEGDVVIVEFLYGRIEHPIVQRCILPPQEEGTNDVELASVPAERGYHWGGDANDTRVDKDGHYIRRHPKDRRTTVGERHHEEAVDERIMYVKDGDLYIAAKNLFIALKENLVVKADQKIIEKAKQEHNTLAPKITNARSDDDTGTTLQDPTVNETTGQITIQPAEAYDQYPNFGTGPAAVPTGDGTDAAVLSAAQTQIGQPYVRGGQDPTTGFDCSGYAIWSGQTAGALPLGYDNTANGLYNDMAVHPTTPEAGDFVFFGSPGAITHVGIVSDPAAGTMVHAGSPGTNITTADYSRRSIVGYGRPSGGLS